MKKSIIALAVSILAMNAGFAAELPVKRSGAYVITYSMDDIRKFADVSALLSYGPYQSAKYTNVPFAALNNVGEAKMHISSQNDAELSEWKRVETNPVVFNGYGVSGTLKLAYEYNGVSLRNICIRDFDINFGPGITAVLKLEYDKIHKSIEADETGFKAVNLDLTLAVTESNFAYEVGEWVDGFGYSTINIRLTPGGDIAMKGDLNIRNMHASPPQNGN